MQATTVTTPVDRADTVIVLDFETTGLSPAQGDRAIEIGAVRLEHGRITGHFQELMQPGRRISSFIENYTGISNAMLSKARPCEAVMADFAGFLGDSPVVAHNASFDQRFLAAEFARIGQALPARIGCSMLLSRRVFPGAPSHRLGSLVAYKSLPHSGVFHRALADAEMTAHLWLELVQEVQRRAPGQGQTFSQMLALSRLSKAAVQRLLG